MSPIQNHPGQLRLWTHSARFKVVVAGRRWGKTIYLREQLLKWSQAPRAEVLYVAPTRMQAKDIMWRQLKEACIELGWGVKINESELKVERSNGAIIQLMSAEKPGRIRGRGLNFVALDEYAEYRSSEIWDQVVRPALSDRGGHACFAMTPKGFNHGYDIYNYAGTEENWGRFNFRTIDSPIFKTEEGRREIEEAKRNLSERDFRQEYEASFENFAGRVYYAFDRSKCNSDLGHNNGLPVIVGMDFNRSPMTAACFQLYDVDGKKVLHQFDEVFLDASDTPEMCRVLQYRFGKNNIIVRPDATGVRTTTVNANLSDHHILREHGFTVQCTNKNPSRVDRWAAVNRAFEKGWVTINVQKCPKTVRDLEVICYKEGTCEPMLSDPMLGHIADGHGYAVHWEFPVIGQISVSRYK